MTDLELNKKLALAIGWREDQMEVLGDFLYVEVVDDGYREFDHTDWRVAGPIAEKFELLVDFGNSLAQINYKTTRADTPQRAIALAVIGAGK